MSYTTVLGGGLNPLRSFHSLLRSRFLILIAAVGMQLCLGATYSWSVYVHSLKELTGLSQGPVQLPFSVFYVVFPATMLFSGTFLTRIGPRLCAISGSILFGGGWFLASLGRIHFGFTILGIGFFGGVGVGLAYIVPIATCIRWFPGHKGLVTGIAVAGFGGGAALVTQVADRLMQAEAATPFLAFRVLGVAFLLLVTLSATAMRNPPGGERLRDRTLKVVSVIQQRTFRVLYVAMLTGLVAGFVVNANMKELHHQGSTEAGVAAVALFAVANALGRICWGLVFDRVSSASAVTANLLFQALLLFTAPWTLVSATGLQAFACVAGFNYGGVLVLYASAAARSWGAEHVGQVYGWLFSANIPAAFAPVVAGFVYDARGSFAVPFLVIGVALASASLVVARQRADLNLAPVHR